MGDHAAGLIQAASAGRGGGEESTWRGQLRRHRLGGGESHASEIVQVV